MPIHTAEQRALQSAARPTMIKTSRGYVETVVWGDGPAVLALHGAMGGYDQGIILARTVASPTYRFVSISRPGYLGTAISTGRTPQEQADLCVEVLDHLGISKAAVIAISGGGPTALQFALRYAPRCSSLIMISACSGRLSVPVPIRWQMMKLLSRVPGIATAMRNRMAKDPLKAAARMVSDLPLRQQIVQDPEVWPLLQEFQKSVFDRMRLRIRGTDNDIFQTRCDMPLPLEQIVAPTLVVHGTNDSVVPYEQAESLVSRVPGAQLLAIEGGEHVSIFTHRAQVKGRVDAFLAPMNPEESAETHPARATLAASV